MLIKKWSGNDTSKISLADKDFDALYIFCRQHRYIYVFGEGKIGTGIKQYLHNAHIPFAGFVTSKGLPAFRKRYAKGREGIIIGVADKYLQEVLPLLAEYLGNNDAFLLTSEKREFLGKHFSFDYVREKFHLNVFVTNSCDLHCRSCSTFAPICKTDHYSLDRFSFDIKKFASLSAPINVLKFTGGEPFLHPNAFDFFSRARETYPNTRMECYTNGLSLLRFNNAQLERLSELKIELTITVYPLPDLNFEFVYDRLNACSVEYNVIEKDEQKVFSKRPLNFDCNIPEYMFINCPRCKFYSLFIHSGRLYKCTYVIGSKYFNEHFKTNLKVRENDFLDLNRVESREQLFDFLVNRIPFCGYCEPISELVPWGLSEGKIEEWS
jgi:hypothetical protein